MLEMLSGYNFSSRADEETGENPEAHTYKTYTKVEKCQIL
jgi:hypothetical protein